MSTATIAPNNTVTRGDFVLGVILSSGFRMADDGWLYPRGEEPLVRVYVNDVVYAMERRRTPKSAWMKIVKATVSDFDQSAFEAWAENWPLTA